MLKVGLTGNIGSGKSVISGIFKALGIPVYPADDHSKKFLSDPDVLNALKKKFGNAILDSSGNIDRKALAGFVFRDPIALEFLNHLTHPKLDKDFREWCASFSDAPYIVMEAAILIEAGFYRKFDKVIYVSCPEEIAIERVIRRDGITRESVLARLSHQMPDSEKSRYADFTIVNDGYRMLIPQVIAIHQELLKGNPYKTA
ncbi:MAG: dephospho-CoA kinase [Bacteroidota bacterium]|nr:dephospho-CoA kinase [Bacteroidota bacterium]